MQTAYARRVVVLLLLLAVVSLILGCSINKIAVNVLADTLSGDGGGSVFTTDDDPELVGDALPFALKLYETILQQAPDNEGLLLATGSGFISYANAFVATPASMMSFEDWELQQSEQARAKKLYIRGRDYLIDALDFRYPGFKEQLFVTDTDAKDQIQEFVQQMGEDDVPYLYWIGAGWVAAFALDAFDLDLAFTVPRAQVLMLRALELNETYNDGAIHDFLVQYYASLPESMGGDKEKAEYHYQRAVEIADGRLAGPYLSYAETVVIPKQDVDLFVSLMQKALAVDPEAYPEARLVNILAQRKAQWYLDNLEDFFLLDTDVEGEEF